MRRTQDPKLNLMQVCILTKLKLCHLSLHEFTIVNLKLFQTPETSSVEDAPLKRTQASPLTFVAIWDR